MTAPPLLELRGLSKRFGNLEAVRDVDMTVRRGDVYGFLGLNGAGKTTTLRMVLGLLTPTSGSIRLFGEERPSARRAGMARLGAMVEGPAFYPYLSGLDNLRILGRLAGPVDRADAERVLDRVSLAPAARQRAGTYSLGMKQRLGIALALISKPEFLVLDEPLNGLDPRGILEMRTLLRSLNADDGVTILISSHLLHEIELSCNRLGIINRGRLVVEENLDALLRSLATRVEVAVDDTARAAAVARTLGFTPEIESTAPGLIVLEMPAERMGELNARLVAAGVVVSRLAERRLSLEEVFMLRSAEAA